MILYTFCKQLTLYCIVLYWQTVAINAFNVFNVFKIEQGQCFFVGLSCSIPTIIFYYFSLSLLSVTRLVLWGWGVWTDRVFITLSLSLALPTSFNNNNNFTHMQQSIPPRLLIGLTCRSLYYLRWAVDSHVGVYSKSASCNYYSY